MYFLERTIQNCCFEKLYFLFQTVRKTDNFDHTNVVLHQFRVCLIRLILSKINQSDMLILRYSVESDEIDGSAPGKHEDF